MKEIIESLDKSSWYVALTKPRLEKVAKDNLLRQDFTLRPPMFRKVARRKVSLEPLFPRYIFPRPASKKQSISSVRSTIGVSSMVRFGTNLTFLSNDRCERIMAFAETQQNRGIESLLDVRGISIGETVLIKDGVFKGFDGLVSSQAKNRVMVLMSLLGNEQMLGFDPALISAV